MGTLVRKSRLKSIQVMLLAMVMFVSMFSMTALANGRVGATADEQAKRDLTVHVYSQMSGTSYAVQGGGTLSGADLFEGSPTEGYVLDADAFQTLSSKAQSEVVSDIATYSNNAVDRVDGVSTSTVQNWWKELQMNPGVGSKFLNEILKNTKPDFVTANQIYAPFSGVVGTILGLLAVLLMAFLGIVMVLDISYITLPPVRMLVSDSDEKGGKPNKSKLFSHDALYAVECAESNSDSTSGGGKQALGIYLKRRIIALILLGICLVYLVQGALYQLVGIILDLMRGFLGF